MQHFYPFDPTIPNDELQSDYIYWSYSIYWKVETASPRFIHSPEEKKSIPNCQQLSLIQDLYYQGYYLLKILNCSFDSFHSAILSKKGCYPVSPWNPIRYKYHFYNHNTKFRHKLKYQKKSNHKQKEYSHKELSKLEWRIFKGFNKDRNNKKHSSNRRTFAKKLSNKYHRQWERSIINKEKWDDLFDGTNQNIFDPWMWD